MIAIRTFRAVSEVAQSEWDGLQHGPAPVLHHGFLLALEESGSVGAETGWEPHYLCAHKNGKLAGAIACFRKTDSYGEYIFDWAWAQASQRAGIPYYPKLVVAAPFTPVTGQRILLAREADADVSRALISAVKDLAVELGCRSVHWLFTTAQEQALLSESGYMPRASFQFHWKNQNYASFEDFLDRMTSRRRKQIKKERERVRQSVGDITWVAGPELGKEELQVLDGYYRRTVAEHGGYDYLRPGFFERLHVHAPSSMLLARCDEAAALFYQGQDSLYGRYWGAARAVPYLHFELAYYAAIERCIDKRIALFEAGAQGEHKLLRGLAPARTYSSHAFADRRLGAVVKQFVELEAQEVAMHMARLDDFGPYRNRVGSEHGG